MRRRAAVAILAVLLTAAWAAAQEPELTPDEPKQDIQQDSKPTITWGAKSEKKAEAAAESKRPASRTAAPEDRSILTPETPATVAPETSRPVRPLAAPEALPETRTEARPASQQAIQTLLSALEDGFNQNDGRALAACWTATGDFIDHNGDRIEGRAQIEKAFTNSLAARQRSKLQLHVLSLRVVNDDLALVETLADVKPPVRTVVGEPGFHLVLVKKAGSWLIESARESVIRPPEQRQHLKELEWLVGDWADDVATETGLSLRSTCGWTENRSFLIRRFKLEGKNGIAHAGTEVIGWDPHNKRIRSWVFDSNGGFGENVWVADGGRWLVRYTGTLADGSDVAATNVLTAVDADTMTLQAKDRTVNGQPQPATPEVTLKRQGAARPAVKAEEPR
jgi:uncharacterized protein (TIGR02246 family)